MKPFFSNALLAALLAVGTANAATTTPVGYVTETLRPGQYNLVGLTLHKSAVYSGVLTSATSSTVSASAADFGSLLTSGSYYTLELEDGTVQEISSWSGSSLTTPQDISSHVTGGTTKFKLRKIETVASVFGATNSAGLTPSPDGGLDSADTLVIPTSSGLLTVYYFNDGAGTTGWYDASGNPAENTLLPYSDGFFVQRASGGSNISLVLSGEVKLKPTSGVLDPGYNYLSAVTPYETGLTLATSNLASYISHSADGDPSTVDNVLLPTTVGSYVNCYYFDDGAGTTGWYTASGDPADTLAVNSGFLIYNVGSVKSYTVAVPSSFSSL